MFVPDQWAMIGVSYLMLTILMVRIRFSVLAVACMVLAIYCGIKLVGGL